MNDYTPEHVAEEVPKNPMLNASTYDVLRFLVVIVLPSLGALYFGLAQIWGLPKAEEVVGTLALVNTFGGVLLRTARKSYENSESRYDGAIVLSPGEYEDTTDMRVRLDPAAVAGKKEVLVKVTNA